MPRKKRYYNPWGQGGYEFDKWLLNLAPAEGQNAYQAEEAYNAYAKNSETVMQGSAQNYGETGLQNAFQNMLTPAWQAERDNAQAAIEQGWQQQLQGLNGPSGRPEVKKYPVEIGSSSYKDYKPDPNSSFVWDIGSVYNGPNTFIKGVVAALNKLVSTKGVGDVKSWKGKDISFENRNVIKDFLKGGAFYGKAALNITDGRIREQQPSEISLFGLQNYSDYRTSESWGDPRTFSFMESSPIFYNPLAGLRFIISADPLLNKNEHPPFISLLHEFAHIWMYNYDQKEAIRLKDAKGDLHEMWIINDIENPAIDIFNTSITDLYAKYGKRYSYAKSTISIPEKRLRIEEGKWPPSLPYNEVYITKSQFSISPRE